MMLLHHVTWSVNSICHMFGSQPATQKDSSTNFAPLGIISFGEAWHNFHHAFPRSARHGALAHQIDPGRGGDPAVRAGRLGHRRALADRSATRDLQVGLAACAFPPRPTSVVGGIVVVIGVDALRHVREPKQILLASLPLLFGLHQIDEAFVWWGLQGHVSESIERVGVWIYVLFALAALPALVPVAVLAVERSAGAPAAHRRVRGAGDRGRCRARRRAVPGFGRRRDRRPPHRVRRERVDARS